MTMKVKNNMPAMNALNQLDRNHSDLTKQLQKLSSGMNINSAKDDPSAYAISERMRTMIRGLDQDLKNTQNARALMNTAEGAVQSTLDILKTFKEKALNAANDTNTDTDRATIQRELDQLIQQIDDNAHVTYNGKILLNGDMGGNMAADEQGVIVDFMSYLDNSTLSAQDALDGAINYASGGLFQNEQDLKSRFLSDFAGGGDLLGLCGIDLTNEDTGAITGADAGGEKVKTKDSIVPEEGNPFTGGVPSGATNINGLTVHWDTADTSSGTAQEQEAKKKILEALSSQWLQNCMNLVEESYEINFKQPGTFLHDLDVYLDSATGTPDGTLAFVSWSGNTSDHMELHVNMDYYTTLIDSNPSGESTTTGAKAPNYLDRTIAHELTHAVMMANISNFGNISSGHLYITEGLAELVHGIDDVRKPRIEQLTTDNGRLSDALTGSPQETSDPYAAGYMILRYMAHQAAEAEPEKRMVFQIGTKANQAIKVGLADMRAEALGLVKNGKVTCQVTTQKKATAALNVIDRAITKAIKQQTSIGAVQSRLDFTAQNITTAHENVTASESTIRDADMARAFTDYTKANVLMQTAQSMLAQANQNSSNALSLLQ